MRFLALLTLVLAPTLTSALLISVDEKTIESSPIRLAIRDFYNSTTPATLLEGGVPLLARNASIDLASNAETQSLRNYIINKNLRVILTVTEVYYRIVADRRKGILELKDLRGKRIGSIPSTSAAYFTSKFLASVGVAESEYTLVPANICVFQPCPSNSLPEQLRAGRIDAVSIWEPSPQISLDILGENAIAFYQPNNTIYREQVSLHTTVQKLNDPAKRASIVQFVRALLKAQKVYREEPEKVWPLISNAIGIDLGVLQRAWPLHFFRGYLSPDLVEVLKEEERWLARAERRAATPDEELEKLVDYSIYEEALAAEKAEAGLV